LRHLTGQTGIDGIILEPVGALLKELEELAIADRRRPNSSGRIPAVDLDRPVKRRSSAFTPGLYIYAGFITAAGVCSYDSPVSSLLAGNVIAGEHQESQEWKFGLCSGSKGGTGSGPFSSYCDRPIIAARVRQMAVNNKIL
jgi:hypothetical protein